ncbi:MAG: hypothetical protein KH135_05280 [Firmicutes bacterium]|nr:hypothetical protein [Bacillota bacterium]
MASAMIHISVAKEINKICKMDEKQLFLGAIAPDISKQIGMTKKLSHFLDDEKNNLPNLERFLKKYGNQLNHPFILGYYIHLYTDYLWFKYFIPDMLDGNCFQFLTGEIVPLDLKKQTEYIYNDYTNINVQLLDEYQLDLSLFYEPVEVPNISFDEIPIDKLQILVDAMSVIIENTKEKKSYLFDIKNVKQFVKQCTEIIGSDILEKQKEETN